MLSNTLCGLCHNKKKYVAIDSKHETLSAYQMPEYLLKCDCSYLDSDVVTYKTFQWVYHSIIDYENIIIKNMGAGAIYDAKNKEHI